VNFTLKTAGHFRNSSLSFSLSVSLPLLRFMLSHKIKFYASGRRNTVQQLKNNKSHFDDGLHLEFLNWTEPEGETSNQLLLLFLSMSLSLSPIIFMTINSFDMWHFGSGPKGATVIGNLSRLVTWTWLVFIISCLLSNNGREAR